MDLAPITLISEKEFEMLDYRTFREGGKKMVKTPEDHHQVILAAEVSRLSL